MATALEIIQDAHIELGVLVAGLALADDDLAWAIRKFNRFLKTKSVDALNLHVEVNESFTPTAGKASYTIGTGGDFDTARPNTITSAFIRDANGHDYPLDIRVMSDYWELSEKSTQDRPTRLYYQREFPLGKIYLYFVPATSEALHIQSYKPLTTYEDVDSEDVVMPGEYDNMFIYNLAISLAPRYGRTPTQELIDLADNTLNDIRSDNLAKTFVGVNVNYLGDKGGTYDIEEG
jgi:hypothetical protein